MSILKVARMGHPVLRKSARDLTPKEIKSDEIQKLIFDMRETMDEYGGIGLAAPQVYEPIRLAIVGYDETGEAGEPQAYINPKVIAMDKKKQGFWEGCLSVPGLRGLVFRPRKIKVEYLDSTGKQKSLEAEGFLATVFQHEFDHLDGKLYVDRIKDTKNFAFEEEYGRYLAPVEDGEVGELED